ncbi:MAG: AAA family ATPase [Paracoccaceae bacterium]|nr:AAA family ATPase [Paracoccaceae bacterium]
MIDKTSFESLKISGFKSLKDIDLSLGNSNLLIGSNGSGKSNILRFFEMLNYIISGNLRDFVEQQGGADDLLFGGIHTTDEIKVRINIKTKSGPFEYEFKLKFAQPNSLYTEKEYFILDGKTYNVEFFHNNVEKLRRKTARSEKGIGISSSNKKIVNSIFEFLSNSSAYQFHDTSNTSGFKVHCDFQDNNFLHSNGGNLAAILYRLEKEDRRRYELICQQIARVLPVFDRFTIEESYGKVLLRWKAKGMGKTFGPHLTSDGSLRFFALVTLLNLPKEMLPNVLLLDEPELGLHPKAVILIGNMINSIPYHVQTIVATQSPLLVDQFEVDKITVLDLENGCTKCRKLKFEDYEDWLNDDFSPGELWLKNLFGGRP